MQLLSVKKFIKLLIASLVNCDKTMISARYVI